MCTKCKDDRCIGMYLLHPKELNDRFKLMKKELTENENRKFILIVSPSSGELFTKFFELHVIDNVDEKEAKTLVDKRFMGEYTSNVDYLMTMTDEQIAKIPETLNNSMGAAIKMYSNKQ